MPDLTAEQVTERLTELAAELCEEGYPNARDLVAQAAALLRRQGEMLREASIAMVLADVGLATAADRFRECAALHAAKGTPDGDEKAQRNADMAYSVGACRLTDVLSKLNPENGRG